MPYIILMKFPSILSLVRVYNISFILSMGDTFCQLPVSIDHL